MPTNVDDADIRLVDTAIELDETEVDAQLSVDDPSQLQNFLDKEEEQLKEMVDNIADTGADVVFCQKGIDDMAQHYLAEKGILAVRRAKKSDIEFLKEVLGARIVSDLESATAEDLGHGSVTRDEAEGLFYVEGSGDEAHGVTLLLRGSTDHVVDELERGVTDALDVVASTVANGSVLGGGGAPEVEVARRLRDYADSVEGREQLAIEAFADAVDIIPRTLAENAGLDPIDSLVDLRSQHADGDSTFGLDAYTGDVIDMEEEGVVEPLRVKTQAIESATEAAVMILRIDDVIAAGDLKGGGSDDDDDEEMPGGPGGGMGGMGGGMGGMGGGMGGMM
jgi:chaperonin GroEL (HSP60 family)